MINVGAWRVFTLVAVVILVALSVGAYVTPTVYAGPFDFNVVVSITGVPSFYSVRVFADGVFKGNVLGGGSLTIFFSDAAAGVPHTVTVDRYVPDGYPYYPGFPYYSGYWGITYHSLTNVWSFVGPVANGTSNVFYYYPLFLLQIQSDHGRPRGGGWYPAGTWAPISVDTITDDSAGTRYRFDRWEGANFGASATEANNRVLMDAPKTVTAKWITQYLVTINSEHGAAVGGGWYDANSAVSFSVTSPIPGAEGVRFVFTGWGGDYSGAEPSATTTVTRPMTIVANWKTQYWINVDSNGGQISQQSQWVDAGSKFTLAATSPSAVVEKRSRLIFTGWSGTTSDTSQTITLTITAPTQLKANWMTQYYLAVVTPYSEGIGEGWYDAGSAATYSLKETKVPAGNLGWVGVQNVFAYWSGDSSSTLPSGSLTMDSPKVISAVWTTDYATLYIASLLGVFVGLAAIWKRSTISEYVGPALGRVRTKSVPPGKREDAATTKAVPDKTGNPGKVGKASSCSSCGNGILEGAEYCVECGHRL